MLDFFNHRFYDILLIKTFIIFSISFDFSNKLRKLISEFPGIVALDETYTDFGTFSLASSLDDYPNLIIMKSMSKFHGMAGMRLGYALANEFLISRLKELLPAFNVNIMSLELAKKVIQEKEPGKKRRKPFPRCVIYPFDLQ